MTGTHASIFERMLKRVDIDPQGCWIYTGALVRGYGQMRAGRTMRYTHILAYEFAYGPVSPGLQLDHLCRNRACFRPTHLEPVAQKVNIQRGEVGKWQVSKTHCPQGHEYTAGNTGRTRKGHRYCRACKTEKSRAARALRSKKVSTA